MIAHLLFTTQSKHGGPENGQDFAFLEGRIVRITGQHGGPENEHLLDR
jgi:hypothetical protein